ncbi:MAG: thioredoxin [Patescibacteria group bacterium]|nr:thioredoxin [Patescibacteria group bacterium]
MIKINKDTADIASTFQNDVLGSDKPVLIDFYADWCGPCQMIAPELEKLKEMANGEFEICKIDVDAAGELAGQFGVRSIPTLFVLCDGKVCATEMGFKSAEDLKEMIATATAGAANNSDCGCTGCGCGNKSAA